MPGVPLKTKVITEEIPVYPEAKEKIAYYQEIVTKLDSLYAKANDLLVNVDYKYWVNNTSSDGDYYKLKIFLN